MDHFELRDGVLEPRGLRAGTHQEAHDHRAAGLRLAGHVEHVPVPDGVAAVGDDDGADLRGRRARRWGDGLRPRGGGKNESDREAGADDVAEVHRIEERVVEKVQVSAV